MQKAVVFTTAFLTKKKTTSERLFFSKEKVFLWGLQFNNI